MDVFLYSIIYKICKRFRKVCCQQCDAHRYFNYIYSSVFFNHKIKDWIVFSFIILSFVPVMFY